MPKPVLESLSNKESDIKEILIKSDKNKTSGGSVEKEEIEEISIDTEPASVHFSNYDNVFDENTEQVGTFKYVPKDLEPGELPKLEIKDDLGSPLSNDSSVTNLDAPGVESLADEVLE